MLSIQVVTLPTVLFRKGANHHHSSGQSMIVIIHIYVVWALWHGAFPGHCFLVGYFPVRLLCLGASFNQLHWRDLKGRNNALSADIYIYIYEWFSYQLVYSSVDKFVSRADLVGCSLLRTMWFFFQVMRECLLNWPGLPIKLFDEASC